MRRTTRMVLAFAFACGALCARAEPLDKEYQIDIDRKPLRQVLAEFSKQTGLNVSLLSAATQMSDGLAGPVKGRYTADAALRMIVADSGFVFSRVNQSTVAVIRRKGVSVRSTRLQSNSPAPVAGPSKRSSRSTFWSRTPRGNQTAPGADVEEVLVTAQKRTERLQDVPISISVLNAPMLDLAAITTVNELGKVVPNFSFESAFGTAQDGRVTIRGITGNVRNAGYESGVSVYVDGVYAGRPASQNLNLLNVERVEVLRGPQGTLFGKNTIAGSVNIVTKKPGEHWQGKASVNIGSLARHSVNAHVSGPLSDERLFAGVSFFNNRRNGYLKNNFGGSDLGTEGSSGGDLRIRYVAHPALEMNLRVDYLNDDYSFLLPESLSGVGSVGDGIVYAPGIRTTNVDGIPREERDVYSSALAVDVRLSEHTFSSITAFNRSEYTHYEDNDNSPLDYLFVAGWHEITEFATQEFRVTSPTHGRFDYLLGAHLFRQNVNSDVPFRSGSAYPGGVGLATVFSDIDTDSMALFGHFNYRWTDQLTLTFGARYTVERKRVNDYRAVATGPFARAFSFPRFTDQRRDSDLSPMVSLSYAMSDDCIVYGKVARGFKSGGWNTDFISRPSGTPPPASVIDFGPEYATTYELGLKGSFANRRVTLDVALFSTDYRDLQVQSRIYDPLTDLYSFQFNNAATSTIRGVEVESSWQLSDDVRLQAGLGYTRAIYDSFKAAALVSGVALDYDGNRLQHSPRWNGAVMAIYERPMWRQYTLSASVGYSYKGEFYADAANDPDLNVSERGLLGAKLGMIAAENWDVFLWGENLMNKDYLVTKQKGALLRGTWGMPRTYGVQLSYTF